MRKGFVFFAVGLAATLTQPAVGATIYNNLTPTNAIGIASRPGVPGTTEIEAADDFTVGGLTTVNTASFIGLIVPGTQGASSIAQIVTEMYRVFPLDSNSARTPNVPTRTNSPSDVAFASRATVMGDFTFTTTVLSPTFSTLNSIAPGGIHPLPNQTTGGNGPVTGQEVEIDITYSNAFNLPADHYFFIPQVALSNGGTFYWLSASRPIAGAGTTPFAPDLQAWVRDANLDPDWLRIGTDIVGGAPAPTFNAAFALGGTTVPEPASVLVVLTGLVMIGGRRLAKR